MTDLKKQWVIGVTMEARLECGLDFIIEGQDLEMVDGIDFSDDFITFLPDSPMKEKLDVGYMILEYDDENARLVAIVEYISNAEFTQEELDSLKDLISAETQKPDGIFYSGDEYLEMHPEQDLPIFLDLTAEDKLLKVEQEEV